MAKLDNYKNCIFWPFKKILGPVHVDIQSDKLDYLKKSQANFFQNCIKIKAFTMTNQIKESSIVYIIELTALSSSA